MQKTYAVSTSDATRDYMNYYLGSLLDKSDANYASKWMIDLRVSNITGKVEHEFNNNKDL